MMKQLHFFFIIFILCIGTIIFAQVIPDFQVNEKVGTPYYSTAISVDNSGNFVITWTDGRNGYSDIYAQRYSGDGIALGGNFKVNDDEGSVSQFRSAISSDSNGNFVITWKDGRNEGVNIYAQRYSGDGTVLGSNFIVNDSDTSAVTRPSRNPPPSISSDNSGNFVITWTDDRNEDCDIYTQRYSSDGIALGSNIKVNDDEGNAKQEFPSISSDSSGNFVITWQDARNEGLNIYAQRYSSDGIAIGDNFKVNSDTIANQASISSDKSGNFVIIWGYWHNDFYDIYAQRYSHEGTTVGSNFKVNDDDGLWIGIGHHSISIDGNGDFVISWKAKKSDGTDDHICAQRYSSDGSLIGQKFRVTSMSDSSQGSPDVKLRNGHIYNTWIDERDGKGDIWANVLDWNDPVGIIDKNMPQTPSAYNLNQNYPNPFNPTTAIGYRLSAVSDVELSIYNLLGQKIAILVNERQQAGDHQVEWDASGFATGIYYYRIEAGEFQDVKKMILLR
jgi:hypothetical protein